MLAVAAAFVPVVVMAPVVIEDWSEVIAIAPELPGVPVLVFTPPEFPIVPVVTVPVAPVL